ncbi:hypothetical protein [Paraburkholderia bannensis]|uniref:hypothetical protein n=1 Tax=Paraburkholderia bannensis TaxID=765414 RepID=UPI002AB1CA07|nr:hypothetical protein [Paraburkholderia bannensis]
MNSNFGISPTARRLALCLAAIATGSSIAITWFAGRERGGTQAEQLIWVTVGLSLLLGAHLIPAMARGTKRATQLLACALWACAMVSTGYTHGTFFLSAEQHAGEQRAEQVMVPTAAPEAISTSDAIAVLLRQQARLEGALSQSSLIKCRDNCRALEVRRLTLHSQLDSIKGQLEQAHRVERNFDRTAAERAHAIARQDAQRGDPVSAKLSSWLQVPAASIDLAMAIFFGWLLESLACFSWYVGLMRPQESQETKVAKNGLITGQSGSKELERSKPITLAMIGDISRSAANDASVCVKAASGNHLMDVSTSIAAADTPRPRTGEEEESLLRHALESGAATNSISEIVRLLGCSEGRALTLRRQIAATNPQLLLANHRVVG